MKKLICIFIFILLNFGTVSATKIYLDSPLTGLERSRLSVGKILPVKIMASDVTDLYGYEVELNWNSDVLECMGYGGKPCAEGKKLWKVSMDPINQIYKSKYHVTSAAQRPVSGYTGKGVTLAEIKFYVKKTAPTLLSLSVTKLITSTNGGIQKITHSTVNSCFSTDAQGNGVINFNVDVNDDKKVNILDIVFLAARWGTKPGTKDWDERVDVNNDGALNILDLTQIALAFGKGC